MLEGSELVLFGGALLKDVGSLQRRTAARRLHLRVGDVPHGVLAVLRIRRADLMLVHLILRLYVARSLYHSPEYKINLNQQKNL